MSQAVVGRITLVYLPILSLIECVSLFHASTNTRIHTQVVVVVVVFEKSMQFHF